MFKFIYVIVVILILAGCSSDEERKAAHIQRGNTFSEQANYEKSRIEYKNALQVDPKDFNTRYLLGQILEKLEDWRGAASQYLTIVQFDSTHVPAKLRLAKLYLLGRATDEAAALVQQVLALEPDNSVALYLMAGVSEQKQDIDGALQLSKSAIKADPDNVEALAFFASLLAGKNKTDQAITLLTQGIEKTPDNIQLRLLLGMIYSGEGRNEEAIEQFKSVITLEPNVFSHRRRLVGLFTYLQRLDDAEAVLRDAIEQDSSNTDAKVFYGDFLAQQRGMRVAEKMYTTFIKNDAEAVALRFALAQLYEKEKRADKAKQVYQDIINLADVAPEGLKASVKLARLYAQEQDYASAGELVSRVLDQNPRDSDALILRGNLALIKKDASSAILDYRSVLGDQPELNDVRRFLSRAHLLNKEPEQAKDNLLRIIEADSKDVDARYDLAQLLAQSGEIDKAKLQLKEIINLSPGHVNAHEALFNLYLATNDLEPALALAKQIQSAFGKSHKGYYFAGKVYQKQKKYDASVSEFNQALRMVPTDTKVLASIVQSYVGLKQFVKAEKLLKQQLVQSANNVEVLNLLGQLFVTQNKFKSAISFFDKAQQIKPDWAASYRNLGNAHLAQNDKNSALNAYKKGLENVPDSLALAVDFAAFYVDSGEIDSAISLYSAFLKQHPENEVAANNLAMLLVNYKEDQESMEFATELVQRFRHSPVPMYADSLGWVLYKKGNIDEAIPYLERAAKSLPDAAEVRYHLGMAYFAKNEFVLARRHLEKSIRIDKEFAGANVARDALAKINPDS